MLHTHKEYGEVTGIFVVAALVLQGWRFWKNPQRIQPSVLAVICSIIAVVMVSAAGHLGSALGLHVRIGCSLILRDEGFLSPYVKQQRKHGTGSHHSTAFLRSTTSI